MHAEIAGQFEIPLATVAQKPVLAPMTTVYEWETEADAINYSVNEIIRQEPGLTQMALADRIRITRSVMSKLRQDQIAMPKGKLRVFMEACRSFAVLQWHAVDNGLVIKTKEEEAQDQETIKRLEAELELKDWKLQRAIGE